MLVVVSNQPDTSNSSVSYVTTAFVASDNAALRYALNAPRAIPVAPFASLLCWIAAVAEMFASSRPLMVACSDVMIALRSLTFSFVFAVSVTGGVQVGIAQYGRFDSMGRSRS